LILGIDTSISKKISFKSVYSSVGGISIVKVSSVPDNGFRVGNIEIFDFKIDVFVGNV
jgi:hypothetical protein